MRNAERELKDRQKETSVAYLLGELEHAMIVMMLSLHVAYPTSGCDSIVINDCN